MVFHDLREYLEALKKKGLLNVVERRTRLETELMPIVRLQFRGLPENQRKGFLFTNVYDAKGRSFDAQVCTGVLSSSLEIYATGMGCKPSEVAETFAKGIANPIKPRLVEKAKCQEVVVTGKDLDSKGLSEIPFPVEIPGYSCQVRTTTAFITKDIETGVQNAGTYSGQVFGPRKILWEVHRGSHGFMHLRKAAKAGAKTLDAAIVIGGPPYVQYTAAAKIPYGLDEIDVAGGIAGEPIEVVKCKTVDLVVPANAEWVIEGKVSTSDFEPQTPFGEYTGYVAVDVESQWCPVMEVTAVTHRKDMPIFQTIISQMPPSESSKLRQVAYESAFMKFLRNDCGLPAVKKVAFHESSGSWQYCVIQLKKDNPTDSMRALVCASGYAADIGKVFVAVDDDIDPFDPDSVNWALSFRMQPHRDIQIIRGKTAHLDPSVFVGKQSDENSGFREASAILIDATRKTDYPPTSLPKQEYMENARRIWEEMGLPALSLKQPWFGYNLEKWGAEYDEFAKMIINGEHFRIGTILEKRRKKMSPDQI
ncbi:UbiD family decarboxylase [Thermoplasmatales archaeon AK]|nr:UbiD family decarboxylase [Thermoplasmatales archaeon AK]